MPLMPLESVHTGKYKMPKGVDKDVTAWTGPDAYKGCFCVITMNSNAAVEAVMHGIPVISTDPGSMVQSPSCSPPLDCPIQVTVVVVSFILGSSVRTPPAPRSPGGILRFGNWDNTQEKWRLMVAH